MANRETRELDESYLDPDDNYVRRLADAAPDDDLPSLEEWRRLHALAEPSIDDGP